MSNIAGLDGLYTPGSRLVMGSLTERVTKDAKGQPIPPEKQPIFFGIATPKSDPASGELVNTLYNMAVGHYNQMPLVMNQINMGLAAPDFAWKIDDGDVAKADPRTGRLRDIPDYMRGCYIFKFSTLFDFGACNFDGVDINRADIKRGDFVDVKFNSSPNGNVDDTAGIYLNPIAIRLLGYGDAIAGGITASNAFADRGAARPVGASEMPTSGGATPPAQQQQQMQQQPAQQPAQQQQQQMQQQPAQQGGGMPQGNGQPAPAPAHQGNAGMPDGAGAPQQTAYPTSTNPNILQPPAQQQQQQQPPAQQGGGMPGV